MGQNFKVTKDHDQLVIMMLPWLQKPERVSAEADSDEESAADMEEFEDSGMLDADDPVSDAPCHQLNHFIHYPSDVTVSLK